MTSHIVFYGTLMGGTRRQAQLGVDRMLTALGPCTIRGTMYELPTCPGLIDDGGREYKAQVYQVDDLAAIDILDLFEEYDEADEPKSRYLRRVVNVPEHGVDAWVYFLATSALPARAPLVSDRSWAAFVGRAGKVTPAEAPPRTEPVNTPTENTTRSE